MLWYSVIVTQHKVDKRLRKSSAPAPDSPEAALSLVERGERDSTSAPAVAVWRPETPEAKSPMATWLSELAEQPEWTPPEGDA